MYLFQDWGVNLSFKFSVRRRKFTAEVTAAPPQSGAGESGAGRREQSGGHGLQLYFSEMATWFQQWTLRLVSGPWETPGGQMKIARYQWKIIKLETSRNGSLFTTSQFLFSLLGERISLKWKCLNKSFWCGSIKSWKVNPLKLIQRTSKPF